VYPEIEEKYTLLISQACIKAETGFVTTYVVCNMERVNDYCRRFGKRQDAQYKAVVHGVTTMEALAT
jgi:hypothetical protein